VFGLFAGLAHDPLIREVFTPLSAGGRLAIRNRDSKYEVEESLRWMAEQGINEVSITPSLFMMMSEGKEMVLPDIRHYFFCGESLASVHVQRAHKVSPHAGCVNFYGATETPQVMGYYEILEDFDTDRDLIPIGHGIDEVQLYLSNGHGMELGLGELGEVCIKTAHLSNGYLNNETLNTEKFSLPDEKKGLRIYRTGDFGCYQLDGSILIQGRKDEQINVRGYRMETKEIVTALMAHSQVANAVVSQMEAGHKKQVAAFLVLKNGAVFNVEEMRKFLQLYLPVNVLPERFVLLDAIPLTPNGKVDYRRLQKEFLKPLKFVLLPRNEMERKVKKIWSDILNTENFGIDDNFFDIGGHSLLLAQMKALIDETFGVEIKILDLFNYPSVSALCGFIKT
jgi:acyl-coenzyme A synthetase/AMP-(fatty) acid ligase/acyl carrier protein